MQITRFFGSKIHGYLDFDVAFNLSLTFLTGINGSGKTTVIQSIIALISPSLMVLANLDFERIGVDLIHDDERLTIEANKSPNEGVAITTSVTSKALPIKSFTPDPDEPPFRAYDKEQDYYRDLLVSLAGHEVIQVINKLPTPMFLDLDRRARALLERREGRVIRPIRRYVRNIFSISLALSMEMATGLVEGQYRDSLIAIGRFGEELRKAMILDLLELEASAGYGAILVPTKEELSTVTAMRRSIEALPHILQLPRDEIDRRIIPTLDTLEKLASEMPKTIDLAEYLNEKGPSDPGFQALLSWNANRSQLKKLVGMVERVKNFNDRREREIKQVDSFREITNSFLKDSEKEIFFDESGYLWFRIKGLPVHRPISSLSSGEGQLFVIISHLFFNPLAREANVFIIDEPELSLHVQWQELFVQSVIAANPKIQYIMATHFPRLSWTVWRIVEISAKPTSAASVVRYSARAVRALAFLKQFYNDVEIYVEDTGCHNMLLFVFQKILGPNVRLASVNQLGGKREVLKACKLDQADDGRKKLYIVDGDFDYLTGKPKPRLKHLYRLRAYCIENIIIEEAAAVAVASESEPNVPPVKLRRTLDHKKWITEASTALISLFVLYAAAHTLCNGVVTVGFNVHRLCGNARGIQALNPQMIGSRMRSICRQMLPTCSLAEIFRVGGEIRKRSANFRPEHYLISGKDYLCPLLQMRLRSVVNYKGSVEELKVRLASHYDPRNEPYLARRLRAVAGIA